jgi:hypothetical protein
MEEDFDIALPQDRSVLIHFDPKPQPFSIAADYFMLLY